MLATSSVAEGDRTGYFGDVSALFLRCLLGSEPFPLNSCLQFSHPTFGVLQDLPERRVHVLHLVDRGPIASDNVASDAERSLTAVRRILWQNSFQVVVITSASWSAARRASLIGTLYRRESEPRSPGLPTSSGMTSTIFRGSVMARFCQSAANCAAVLKRGEYNGSLTRSVGHRVLSAVVHAHLARRDCRGRDPLGGVMGVVCLVDATCEPSVRALYRKLEDQELEEGLRVRWADRNAKLTVFPPSTGSRAGKGSQ